MKNKIGWMLFAVAMIMVISFPYVNHTTQPQVLAKDEGSKTLLQTPYTPTTTQTPCPFVTPFTSSTLTKPKLIYILIDKSGSYSQFTQAAIETAVLALVSSVQPGDYIYVAWIGSKSEDPKKYLVYGQIQDLATPAMTPNPPAETMDTETMIITPITSPPQNPEPQTTKTVLLLQVEEQNHKIGTQTAVAQRTADLAAKVTRANASNCRQAEINQANEKSVRAWFDKRDEITYDFIQNTLVPVLTPSINSFDDETRIFEALFIASRVVQSELRTAKYSKAKLVIFSDMDDKRTSRPGKLRVDFSGVDILTAMMYCDKAIFCQDRADAWGTYFKESGANDPVEFKIVQETTPKTVSEFISK